MTAEERTLLFTPMAITMNLILIMIMLRKINRLSFGDQNRLKMLNRMALNGSGSVRMMSRSLHRWP